MLALILLAACQGLVGEPGDPEIVPMPPPPDPDECVATGRTAVGPLDPWRLTTREYRATIAELLGRPLEGVDADLPPDLVANGYDNQIAALTLTPEQARGFEAGAERVAEIVATDAALRRSIVGCDLEADRATCLSSFVASFGRRAYRRPLEGDASDPSSEIGRLIALGTSLRTMAASAGVAPYGGFEDVAAIVSAMLQSPHFVMRIASGVDRGDGTRQLGGYEIATRLSYLVRGTSPDTALLDAAASGELDAVEGIESHARRLLEDPRASAHLDEFHRQWLSLGRIYVGNIDPAVFPQYGPALQDSLYEGVRRILADYSAPGASFLDVFTASYAYADRRLAPIYGVAPPASMERVELGSERAGLLASAGMLAMTSNPRDSSVVHRGLLVREAILCDDIPPPPPNVPTLEPMPDEDPADLQSRHSSDPACASCHVRIDPIGFGLETYDALGAMRTDRSEEEMRAMPRYIDGIEDSEFYGGAELGSLVRDLPQTRACVVRQLFRYSMGRSAAGEVEGRTCSEAALAGAFERGGDDLRELVIAIVTSDEFRFKSATACGGT